MLSPYLSNTSYLIFQQLLAQSVSINGNMVYELIKEIGRTNHDVRNTVSEVEIYGNTVYELITEIVGTNQNAGNGISEVENFI